MTGGLKVALMLETDGPGGAENVAYQLAEELRDRGYVVYPVGPGWKQGWLSAKYRASGFDYRTFMLRRAVDLGALRDIAGLLRELRVDIVHSHEFAMAVYGTAAARLLRKPHIITMHGNQTMTAAWRRRVALRWAFRNSRSTIAVSRATKKSLDHDLGLDPAVVRVIPNGVPWRPGNPEPVRRELGIREGEILILAVGNLLARKGHIVLLQALQLLDAAGPAVPWRLAIAGGRGGDEQERLEAFAAEHGMTDRVHLLLQRDDIPDLQAAAEIFVMPSLWEGLPLALLEAMHAGKAIVATTASGIPEAITAGEHGLLAPPGDPAALAEALRRLLTEPPLRRRLGSAAAQRAADEFSIDAMTSAYERLYLR